MAVVIPEPRSTATRAAPAAAPAAAPGRLAHPRMQRVFYPALVAVILIGLRQGAVTAFEVPRYIVPSPALVAQTLVAGWALLSAALLTTLKIALLAFVAATVLGVLIAFAFVQSRIIETAFFPYAVLLHHVYGTNGLVPELEVGLAPAHPWLEAIVSFDGFDAALEFADAFASAPGLAKKSVSLLAAPIPDLLLQAVPQLAGAMTPGGHAVFVLVAEFAEPGFVQLVGEFRGTVTFRKTADEVRKSNRTIVEYTWNHTTLHALKVDRSLTYIQSGFDAGRHVQQARTLREKLGDEVLVHLEFIRTKEGAMNCSGLQNLRVYIVEDSRQGQVNPDVVATKLRFDPQGLLNPGKLRGRDVRDLIIADAAAGGVSLATLPRF